MDYPDHARRDRARVVQVGSARSAWLPTICLRLSIGVVLSQFAGHADALVTSRAWTFKPAVAPKLVEANDCSADVRLVDGIVKTELFKTSMAGKTVQFSLGPFQSAATFDAAGLAHLEAPLFTETDKLAWTFADGSACEHEVSYPDYRDAFAFAIFWTEPSDTALNLDLHAIEPGSVIDAETGYVSRTRPKGGTGTLGEWHGFGVHAPGAMRIQAYSVPSSRPVTGGIFNFRVEFTSRGEPAAPPFCKGHAHERISFQVIELMHSELHEFSASFGPRPCLSSFDTRAQGFARFEMRP